MRRARQVNYFVDLFSTCIMHVDVSDSVLSHLNSKLCWGKRCIRFQRKGLTQYRVMDDVIVNFTNVLALFLLLLNFAKTSKGKIIFLFPDITLF